MTRFHSAGLRKRPIGGSITHRTGARTLTCGGQHGAGEKQGGREVPVPVGRGVVEDGDAVIARVQGFLQEALQALLRQALVLLQELLLDGPQLLAQDVLVRQLHRGKDHGAEHQIEDVAQDEGREIPRRFVILYHPHARIAG